VLVTGSGSKSIKLPFKESSGLSTKGKPIRPFLQSFFSLIISHSVYPASLIPSFFPPLPADRSHHRPPLARAHCYGLRTHYVPRNSQTVSSQICAMTYIYTRQHPQKAEDEQQGRPKKKQKKQIFKHHRIGPTGGPTKQP
jgi:hypothetical protein